MRSIPATVLLLAWAQRSGAALAHVNRQAGLTLPDCAARCLTTLLPVSTCEPNDTACLCTDEPFIAATEACVQGNCTVRETLTTARIQSTSLCPQPVRDESFTTKVVVWSMFGVAATSVIGRLVSRLPAVGGSGYGWDDSTILLALLLLAPLNALCFLMALIGLGRDIWMVDFDNITRILYYFWIDEYLYTFILGITKISILLLYLRMWPDDDSRIFRRCCLGLIYVLAVHAVVMNIALAAGCEPVSYSWTQWDGEHEGHCISYLGQIYATAALNILFDLLVFLLPLPKLIKLSLSSQRKKFALCLTFTVGLFVTVCSIIRLRYLAVWGNSTNLTRGYNPIAIWSIIECNASVLCACMPALAGLIQRLWARVSGAALSTYGHGSITMRERDERPGGYELRLRSTSLTVGVGREGTDRRYTYPNGLSMNPLTSSKPHLATDDSDSASLDMPDPALTKTEHGRNAWHATQPLPKLSFEA